jgi:DNA-binding NtrC family response regulator
VLIVDRSPLHETLPQTLNAPKPEDLLDVSSSHEDGLSKLETGRYHAVISDARLAEAADFSLLKRTQALPCPLPFLLSKKSGDHQAVTAGLKLGAFDMIRYTCRGAEAAAVVKRALWFYQLRFTVFYRRQRLETFRRRHTALGLQPGQTELLRRTIEKIEEADRLCQQTIEHVESSIRALEETCNHVEAEIRECAMRVARLL